MVPIKIEEAQVELIPSKLECGLVLSKRARDRMYEQKISKEALERCFHEGEQEKQNEVTIFRCADIEMVVTSENMVIAINDTSMESYPFSCDQATTMQMSEIFQAIREDLDIGIWYDDHNKTIRLCGHAKGIERAKKRLDTFRCGAQTIIRIPSHDDKCGRIIGKGGVTINEIKKICNIERNLTVEWDENKNEIVLTSLFLLGKPTITKVKLCVNSVIRGRSLNSLANDECFDVLIPRSTHSKNQLEKVSRQMKKKKLIASSLKEGVYKL